MNYKLKQVYNPEYCRDFRFHDTIMDFIQDTMMDFTFFRFEIQNIIMVYLRKK